MKPIKLLFILLLLSTWMACDKNTLSSGDNFNSTGQGGSLARFTIVNNYLYTVDGMNLNVFNISTPASPVFKNKVQIGFDIEAIFPFNNQLFIASNSAMYIYNISNPEQPVQESFVQHLTGCDPIVANDSIAFLTVHGGTRCGSMINQLQVYDITNITYPQLIANIPMTNPMGLGLKDSVLFVCDNGTGLRVLNVKNPYQIQSMYVVSGQQYLDVIPMDSTMLCMMSNGVAYFDISNLNQIVKIGEVKN